MYQRHELNVGLSPEDISKTLKACDLPEKDEYTEDEADCFKECRSLIEQGKSYKQAAAQMKTQDKSTQETDKPEPEAELLDISELLARASKQCNSRIPLSEVIQILDICSLPDKDEYTSLEGDRFLEACKLIKQQSKSYEEVATHFGINNGLPDISMQQVENIVETMATNADALTDELLQQSAEAKALNDAQKYMVYYAKAAAEGQQVQEFWARLSEHAKSKLQGKVPSPFDSGRATSDFHPGIITEFERFLTDLREWDDERVAKLIAQEKQTIDVRVVKEAKTKASQMLKDNQQWLLLQQRRSEQRRKSLGWLLSVLKYHTWTWAFIIWWGAIAASWGWIGGINTPISIVCSTRTSLCYQARIWGTKVASADVPTPKCTKTRNGLVCLYPKRSPYKTRTQNQPK